MILKMSILKHWLNLRSFVFLSCNIRIISSVSFGVALNECKINVRHLNEDLDGVLIACEPAPV